MDLLSNAYTPLYSFSETLGSKYNMPELFDASCLNGSPPLIGQRPTSLRAPSTALDKPNFRVFLIAPLGTRSTPPPSPFPGLLSQHVAPYLPPLPLPSAQKVELPQLITSHCAARLRSRSPSPDPERHAYIYSKEAARIRPVIQTPPESLKSGSGGSGGSLVHSPTVATAWTHNTSTLHISGAPRAHRTSPFAMSWIAAGPSPFTRARMGGLPTPNSILICEICLMTFYHAPGALEHSAEHGEYRPFICHAGCGCAFDNGQDRELHWKESTSCRREHQASFVHAVIDVFVPL